MSNSIGDTLQRGATNLLYMIVAMVLCVIYPIYMLLEKKWVDRGEIGFLYDISSCFCLLGIVSLFIIGFKWSGLLFAILNFFALINFTLAWCFTDIYYIESTWNTSEMITIHYAVFISVLQMVIGWAFYKIFKITQIVENTEE